MVAAQRAVMLAAAGASSPDCRAFSSRWSASTLTRGWLRCSSAKSSTKVVWAARVAPSGTRPSSARRWRRASGRCWVCRRWVWRRAASSGAPRRAQALCTKRCTSALLPRAACCFCHSGSTSSGRMRRWANTVRLALAFSSASVHWVCRGASRASASSKSKPSWAWALLRFSRFISAALMRAWLMRCLSSGMGTSTPSSF